MPTPQDDHDKQPPVSESGRLPLSTSGPLECALKGTVLLNHPFFNKGSAFTADERRAFELTGLLPPSVQTLEQQARRAYEQYSARADDLAKNTFLTSMKEQNQVLYFKVRQAWHVKDRVGLLLMRKVVSSWCSTTSRRCSASCTRRPRARPSRTSRASSAGLKGCF